MDNTSNKRECLCKKGSKEQYKDTQLLTSLMVQQLKCSGYLILVLEYAMMAHHFMDSIDTV